MEKGFYTWYEDVFNQCSLLVKGHAATSFDTKTGAAPGTYLFSGRFSSSSVVIRMGKPYDFVFGGAWASSFKAFVYRQKNYNQILYDLYAGQLDSRLLKEHQNLYSFLEGHPMPERIKVNKILGCRLDQTFKVILPTDCDSATWAPIGESLNVRSIIKGVFMWKRNFVLVQGEDTMETLVAAGVNLITVLVKTYTLGGKAIEVKFAELDCCGVNQFVVVIPYLADVDSLCNHVAAFRQEVDVQLRSLETSRMSTDFIRPNFANILTT